ncbi:MAG: class I SAM-dependent methyltransferase [Prevotella sp.]|nr:class I SAM-dependent methyltransferase [Prevotella sp.]
MNNISPQRQEELQANYQNWVPVRLLILLLSATLLCAILLAIGISLSWSWPWLALITLTVCVLAASLVYMCVLYYNFSDKGGGLMAKVHYYVISRLPWDGQGKLLDVGCGAGALTIRCAKHFPQAHCTGIDYWGIKWDYSQQVCQQNALAEQVAQRCTFRQGDANHLDFEDETFDAVVSNFVYHEINDGKSREELLRETLRVLRKGGCFALQDLFGQPSVYGNFQEIIDHLKADTIAEIHYADSGKEIPIPSWMRVSGMLPGVGIIYGKK